MQQRILYDVGANEGKYTDINLNKFDKYILVEANPSLAEKLRQKYKTNPEIHIVEAIASNKETETFYISNADTISTSDIEWIQQSRFSNNYLWKPVDGLQTVSLDRLISIYGEPTLLKIDVEGYEYNVLQSLTKKVKLLCFEWAEEKKKEILLSLEYLRNQNYTRFHVQMEDKYDYVVNDSDWYDFRIVYDIMNQSCNVMRKETWGMIWAS
jgi:FkbM family methyltransferase